MRTVLVTGGAGYIGSHVCKALAEKGFKPVVVDDLSAGRKERVQWGPLEIADVRDGGRLREIMKAHKPIAVMHFAALIDVAESVRNPLPTYDVNVGGALAVVGAVKEVGVRHVVFSSTAAVYGIPEISPIAETAATKPINPYGHSKLMVEQMLADVHAADGLTYAALRYFNAAGATPECGLGYQRPKATHLVPLVMQAVLGKGALTVYGTDYPTADGTAVRDYIHVADLAEAHVMALETLVAGAAPMTLNLGASRGTSVREMVDVVERVTGRKMPMVLGERRAGDPPELVADARRAKDVLGWMPTRSDVERIVGDEWVFSR
ncbi:MAG: UDP-glucose 4-epimerase GalE [Alphaproteobacteria bacterium]